MCEKYQDSNSLSKKERSNQMTKLAEQDLSNVVSLREVLLNVCKRIGAQNVSHTLIHCVVHLLRSMYVTYRNYYRK
jgi:hypothetical protein